MFGFVTENIAAGRIVLSAVIALGLAACQGQHQRIDGAERQYQRPVLVAGSSVFLPSFGSQYSPSLFEKVARGAKTPIGYETRVMSNQSAIALYCGFVEGDPRKSIQDQRTLVRPDYILTTRPIRHQEAEGCDRNHRSIGSLKLGEYLGRDKNPELIGGWVYFDRNKMRDNAKGFLARLRSSKRGILSSPPYYRKFNPDE